jgi:hypothetical protein
VLAGLTPMKLKIWKSVRAYEGIKMTAEKIKARKTTGHLNLVMKNKFTIKKRTKRATLFWVLHELL